MKNKHIIGLLLFVAALFLMPAFVLAQTNVPPVLPDIAGDALPRTASEFWKWVVVGVAPLVVAGIKFAVPKIPKLLLPLSTPLIGVALGLGLNALASANLQWVDMAQAGALAVFLRESVDQAWKAHLAKSATSTDK